MTATEDTAGPGIVVRRRRGYTVVHNDLLPADGALTARAWGIFVYLLGRPDGWTARAGHLRTVFKEGRDAIYKALGELVDVGLMERENYYDGNLRRVRYVLNADGPDDAKGGPSPEPTDGTDDPSDAKQDDPGDEQNPRSDRVPDNQEPENPPDPGSQDSGTSDAGGPDAENTGVVSKEVTTTEATTTEKPSDDSLRSSSADAANIEPTEADRTKAAEDEADAVASWWWESLNPKPVRAGNSRSSGFIGFRMLIRGARRAGFTQHEIAKALQGIAASSGDVWPSTAQLDRACRAIRDGRVIGARPGSQQTRHVDADDGHRAAQRAKFETSPGATGETGVAS